MVPDIVVLSAPQGFERAASLVARLKEAQASVSHNPQRKWPRQPGAARRLVSVSRVIVLVWTAATRRDENVLKLAEIASNERKLVVCVLDDTPIAEVSQIAALVLADRIDLRGWNGKPNDPAFEKLIQCIGGKLGNKHFGEQDWEPEPGYQPAKPKLRISPRLAGEAAAAAILAVLVPSGLWFADLEPRRPSDLAPTSFAETRPGDPGAVAEHRRALIIYQSGYSAGLSPLPDTESEAKLIKTALEEVGFKGYVDTRNDLTRDELDRVFDAFVEELSLLGPAAVGFVYFTGHGTRHPGADDNYLLGIDAKLRTSDDIVKFGVSANELSERFGRAGTKAVFLVLDACRDIPGPSDFKTTNKGLRRMDAAQNMLIAYATAEGEVARVGQFAPALAEEIVRPNQPAAAAFTNAKYTVAERTQYTQVPYIDDLITEEVCFNGCPGSGE